MVLGFPEYAPAARRLATAAHLPYATIEVHKFPDGESLVRLPERLPEQVIFCRSLDNANQQLVELELAAATALKLGARDLILVAPYLCYMRQDTAFLPGEAVSQQVIGEWLARRFSMLITVDPHLHRTARLEDAVPVPSAVSLSAGPLMASWLVEHGSQPFLIGPDEESEQWVARIADQAHLEFGVAHKHRFGDREVKIELPDHAYDGRNIVLIDDMVSTGHTMAEAAIQLTERGAKTVSVMVSHALFVDGALECLQSSGVREICSSDSVPHRSNQIHLAKMLARALESRQT